MNYSTDIPEANVEDMSNAELFQYLFRAELNTDLPLPDIIIDNGSSPCSTASDPSSSSSSASPATLSSTSPQSLDSQFSLFDNNTSSSPSSFSLSYNSAPSPPPYIDLFPQQQQQPEQPQQFPLFQTGSSSFMPTTNFSYRQISPDMPPPRMPESTSLVSQQQLQQQQQQSVESQQFLNLSMAATANASTDNNNSTPTSFWMQRFQQLQQLQQMHHLQQQQLLSSAGLLNNNNIAVNTTNLSGHQSDSSSQGRFSGHSSASDRSVSPSSPGSTSSSKSPSVKAENGAIYPSPPMNDEDMNMDSDSDSGEPTRNSDGSDPLKPSPSELKKMTSKERRQLRNKLSARNFRVRRKEYIGALEADLREARREAAELQRKLTQSELNCQFLRQELETSRVSQTLFNDGRSMSREHANLLASLLNPNTESFPTSSDAATTSASSDQQQQKELMDSIHNNNMTILNNSLTNAGAASTNSTSTDAMAAQGSMQPYLPYDGNWELIVNHAELDVNPSLDPKDVQAKSTVSHDLLTEYENSRLEAERDEQMRLELKAYNEQKWAQTYVVVPNKDGMPTTVLKTQQQDTMFLQTIIYMMMLHITKSMFEAATLSGTDLVNMYQTMDAPLRNKMGQVQQEREIQYREKPCKFLEWREAWIKKWWPSYYNNRQRVCELLRLCNSSSSDETTKVEENDVTTTVRKMEEGVKNKTVATSLCLRVMAFVPDWLKCPQMLAAEKQERELLMMQQRAMEEISTSA